MTHPAARIATLLAVVATALTLAACSSGGDEETPDPVDLLLDPRVIRLQRVVERSDNLLVPGLHVGYTLLIDGQRETTDPIFQSATCSGATQCETEATTNTHATTVTLQDMLDFSTFDLGGVGVTLGERGGLDTVDIVTDIDVTGSILSDAINVTPPAARSFGFWGVHGFAGVVIGDGPFSGEAQNQTLNVQTTTPFQGELSFALGYAMGDVTGTNPSGVGSLTWDGIAEVVSTRTFERSPGTVRVVIQDLTQAPLHAGVNIDTDGFRIGPAEWSNMEVTGGRFTHGAVSSQDYLEGNFHGPGHVETYGVFDTGSFTGAFGAKLAN